MKLLAILTLVLLMSKCKRDETSINQPCSGDCVTFKIYLGTDYLTKTPVKKVPIEVGWEEKRYLYYNPGRLIATATTSENGTCVISFRAKQEELAKGNYYIKLFHSDEYHKKDVEYYYISKSDTTVNANIQLISKANLKIVFNDFKPKLSSDYFNVVARYKSFSRGTSYNTALPHHDFRLADGEFATRELSGVTAGNDYTYITVNRGINGIRTQVNDSLYIAKGETKTYTVSY